MIAQTNELRLQVGGTVNPRTGIYIVRPSDEELPRLLERGEYANVFCSRQMGKSSLLVRTKARLFEKGYATAAIDVAGYLGTMEDADDWYQGLLQGIVRQLELPVNVTGWWEACRAITPNQRLIQFFRDEIAAKTSAPVVIFLDEIDSTIALPYTDDFFVAIRAMYNDRASEPLFERITFCLVGVVTPNELIKNRRTTPYNIGKTIELPDFDADRDDLHPLFSAVSDDLAKGKAIVRALFCWTGGHPYLTVRLCDQFVVQGRASSNEVDEMVNKAFVSLDQLHSDVHFQQVLRFLDERIENKLSTLTLYRRILSGEPVRDQTTPAHIHLKLAGIVKRNHRGYLVVRNPIYSRVFTDEWASRDLAPDTNRIIELLEGLDTDRGLAGKEYVRLRRKLVRFFDMHRCVDPESLADETVSRVALKIAQGTMIQNLDAYCLGEARLVVLEQNRVRQRTVSLESPEVEGILSEENLEEQIYLAQLNDCLDRCRQELPKDSLDLLARYYEGGEPARRALADELGINLDALKNRLIRTRSKLAKCAKDCMNKRKGGKN